MGNFTVEDIAKPQNGLSFAKRKFVSKILNMFCIQTENSQNVKNKSGCKGLNYRNYLYLSRLDSIPPVTVRKSSPILMKLTRIGGIYLRRPRKNVRSRYDKTFSKVINKGYEYKIAGPIIKPSVEDLVKKFEESGHFENRKIYAVNGELVDPAKLLPYINYWLRSAVNQLYLNYCLKNNVIPKGLISIPEHLVNDLFYCYSAEDILSTADAILGKYISGDKVFFNCYEKAISDSLQKISKKKREGIKPSVLLPDYSMEDPIKFTYRKNVPSDEFKAKLKKLKSDKPIEYQDLEIMLWEKVSNWITPPKYRVDLSVLFDDELCYEFGSKGRGSLRAYYNSYKGEIVLNSSTRHNTMTHEKKHRELDEFNNHAIHVTVCDYTYEKTKGANIKSLNKYDKAYGKHEMYKPFTTSVDVSGGEALNPYAAKIYETVETYDTGNELIPVLFGDVLLNNGVIDWEVITKRISKSNHQLSVESLKKMAVEKAFNEVVKGFKKRFDELCRVSPELGALVLNYTNAEF